MSEIELKFGLPDGGVDPVAKSLRRLGARSLSIESHYWDSPDRRLAAAGISLRLRKSAGRWEQTVKAPGPSTAERLEETVPRAGAWAPPGPAPDLSLHVGTAAGAVLDAALAGDGGPDTTLEPVHVTTVRRLARLVEHDAGAVEIALDRGTIDAVGRSTVVCELEVELKRGDPATLIAVGRASVEAHGMWLSTVSKSARGERLARDDGDGRSRAVKAQPASFADRADGTGIFRAIVESCFAQVLANASAIADGHPDDDAIHQLRVGLRRLRTAWGELAGWRGALAPTWEGPAVAVFAALGAYRDRRVTETVVQKRLVAAGSPYRPLQSVLEWPPIDPVEVVRGKQFQQALLDLMMFVLEAPGPPADEAVTDHGAAPEESADEEVRALQTIAARLDKMLRRLRRDGRRFAQLDVSERHRVRKRLKRLRYLAELVGPLFKHDRVERFLKCLEPAQDELGDYMDLVVAARFAHEVVDRGDARAWFDVGWISARSPEAVERCRKALRRAAAAPPFWRRGRSRQG